ncbi:MAG: S-layer homology domain-containing protein, partial [Candidatus Methanomethylophilaceae archaeon]|nr:S-layer homology domain-containing protein [Candidatus Methanomethylophilaceae archaeon]
MFKRRILLLALALAMVLGGIPGVSAQDAAAAATQTEFADMPQEGYWSFGSLNAAVKNGLLNGFDLDGAHYIKPEAALTRAQMATIVNRAFGAKVAATLAGVADVPSYAWYANEMAKAIHMGTFMRDTKMRPDDSITRQEAFVVLARAFVLKQNDTAPLNVFSDKAQIASWALPELSAMKAAGYIQGSGGMLHPLDTITRAEFATVMDNMVKQYIDVAGTYTEVVAEGNVIVRVPGVTLDGVDVDGDLVIGDGVGDGNAYLNNIAVSGRALIRGGGENSVVFSGSATDVRNIVISRSSDGRVRILTEEGVVLAEAEVAGDSDVILEGTFGSVTVVSDNVTVTALDATITDMSVPGEDSVVILSGTTTVENVAISGTQSELIVQEDASVDTVEISAPSVTVSGTGTVKYVEVQAGGDEASITTPNTVTTVSTGATGVTAGGEEVPAGSTATNNDTGTDATITEPA